MPIELQSLFVAAVVTWIVFAIEGGVRGAAHGAAYGLGARDEAREPSVQLGRASRTAVNQLQAMAVFTPLVIVAQLADVSTPLTQWGAMLFAGARIVYAPLYLLGVPVLRSLVWMVGVAGIVLIGVEIARLGF